MSFILFDVGTNMGQNSLHQTANQPQIETFAFEPVPALYNRLSVESSSFSDRYHLYPIALSDYDGESTFNISNHDDNTHMGCSSLNEFKENIHPDWFKETINFSFNEQVTVQVRTFRTWYQENNIKLPKIDFFHCDTQGSDLKVLEGMGEYIHMIREGVVECAKDENTKLYKNSHTIADVVDFLTARSYGIVSVDRNDLNGFEYNVRFKRQ